MQMTEEGYETHFMADDLRLILTYSKLESIYPILKVIESLECGGYYNILKTDGAGTSSGKMGIILK
jgi:hypothetical protein